MPSDYTSFPTAPAARPRLVAAARTARVTGSVVAGASAAIPLLYARMSVDAIAAEAGVTKPTVYARYPSKRELAKAALMALGESRDRSAPEETGDTRRDLVAHLRHFQGGVGRPFGVSLVGAVIAEEHETPDLLALYREHIVLPRRQKIRRVLERARDGGELRDGADLDLAVNALVGAYYAQYLEGTPFPESWADSVVDAALEGLRRRAP